MDGEEKYKRRKANPTEEFYFGEKKQGRTIGQFWQWAYSDLMNNMTRAVLAEYIVALAIGQENIKEDIRDPWQSWDITKGDKKIEVKVAAHLQTWKQNEDSGTKINFGLGRTKRWDKTTGKYESQPDWNADVYVLAYFKPNAWLENGKPVNPMNLDQWEFWVLSKEDVKKIVKCSHDPQKRCTHSISINQLQGYERVGFEKLGAKIEEK